jgi:hypothetical protein
VSTPHSSIPSSDNAPTTPMAVLFLRIAWMFAGTMTLAICLLLIIERHAALFSAIDVVYWVTVPAMLACRYVEIARYKSIDAAGEPLTLKHWRNTALTVSIGAAVLWVLVHVIVGI